MAHAFISYSRKDRAFASALKERLESMGFEILIDLEDILGSEDWAKRLVDLIAIADHFVFVISPDACQSRACAVEINSALDLSKIIIPIAFRETSSELIPEPVAARQWLTCLLESEHAACAENLCAIFKASPDWLRKHTELTGQARDWKLARRRSALLRGGDLRRAERWLGAGRGKEPPPSGLQIEFIAQSRRWRRTSRATAAVLVSIVAAGAAAGLVVVDSERMRSADNKRVSIAADLMVRDPSKAGLVLLEVSDPEHAPYAMTSLTEIISRPIAACEMTGHPGDVDDVVFSPTGGRFLTVAKDGIGRLWSTAECRSRPVQEFRLARGIDQALFSADGLSILFIGRDAATLWRVDGTQAGAIAGEFESIWLTKNGDVLALRRDFAVELWEAGTTLERKATFTPFARLPGYGAVDRAFFAPASGGLMLETHGSVIAAWSLAAAGDAVVLPGRGLLSLTSDGDSYACVEFVEKRGREYRRYYDVMLRSVADAREDLREAEHDDPVDAAAFSPDGQFLVTTSGTGLVQVSSLKDRGSRTVTRLDRHKDKVRGVRISPSGNGFVTYSNDRTALLWRFDSLESPTVFQGHVGPVVVAAFSPDGKMLVTGSEDGVARVWSLEPGTEPRIIPSDDKAPSFSADGQFVVAGSRAWPSSGGAPIQLYEPAAGVNATALHPVEPSVAISSADGEITIQPIEAHAKPRPVGTHPGLKLLAFDDVGTHLVSGTAEGDLRVWNLADGGAPVSFVLPPDPRLDDMMAAAKKDPTDKKLQSEVMTMALLSGERGKLNQLGMSTRSGRVLAADATSVYSWPLDRPATGVRVDASDQLIEAAAFDPTGALVATGHAWDHVVRLWRADGSGLIRELGAATAEIEALRFSPDGKHLLVASKDETARVWATGANEPPVVLRGHTSWVVDAHFTRDSRRVVTASYDGHARVWNVDGSNAEIVLDHSLYAARFDPSGSRVVTASGDGKLAVWTLNGKHLQQAIAARTSICLNETFRVRFLAEDPATAARKVQACEARRPR